MDKKRKTLKFINTLEIDFVTNKNAVSAETKIKVCSIEKPSSFRYPRTVRTHSGIANPATYETPSAPITPISVIAKISNRFKAACKTEII